MKPVYIELFHHLKGCGFLFQYNYRKDDFFDSLSCAALDAEAGRGKMKFSELRRIDAEVIYILHKQFSKIIFLSFIKISPFFKLSDIW